MRASRAWLRPLGSLTLATLPTVAVAQPVGEEFQVNTYTTARQHQASVTSDASGNFVVVWSGYTQDGSNSGIFGQRFGTAGGTLGSEFRVNSFTTGEQGRPSVAAADGGDFVVVWDSNGQDGSQDGIFGQRYDSGGNAQGVEFRVNSYTTSNQRRPEVASDASGNFVVVWESYGQDGSRFGVFGQRYDSAGVARGNEFRVNSFTTSLQTRPAVASDSSGNFVVAWQSQDGSYFGIFGQRYDSAGSLRGAEFRVNSYTTGDQLRPAVASDADGNFVVVWETSRFDQDGSLDGVFAQRYDSEGVAQGDQFQVNSFTQGPQNRSSVAFDASGNFFVFWESDGDQDGDDYGVFGQRYDSGGAAQGDEFQINSYTTNSQRYPSAGVTDINQFVVAWNSGGDGHGYGVFGQRFDFGADTIAVVSPNTNVRWRIGSSQKIQWTHTLGANASFRIELDRNDDGDFEELIAAHAHATSATRGSFAWTVSGPASATARVRVSLTGDPGLSDASDVTFQIRPAPLSATESLLRR